MKVRRILGFSAGLFSIVSRPIRFLAPLFWSCLLALSAFGGDGDLDRGFGDNGLLYFIGDPLSYDELVDPCLQPDGKIIGIGVNRSVFRTTIVRFNSDGTFDTTFGSDGRVTYDSWAVGFPEAGVILEDGKYFIVGYHLAADGENSQVMMMRLESDGSLDKSFAKGGVLLVPGKFASDVLELPDGRIIVGAKVEGPSNEDFAFICLNSNGSLDRSFGEQGLLTIDFGSHDTLAEIALMPDGRLLAAGLSTSGSLLLCMLTATGSVDDRFGSGGTVELPNIQPDDPSPWPPSWRASVDLAVQLDGRIVVGGFGLLGFYVATLNPEGSFDSMFVQREVSRGAANGDRYWIADICDLAIQADGKIVVAGAVDWNSGVEHGFLLARYHADGRPDLSFGTDGWVGTDFPRFRVGNARSVLIQPDGKILAGGYGPDPEHHDTVDMALARYLSSIDPAAALAGLTASFEAGSAHTRALTRLVQQAARQLQLGHRRAALNALSDLERRVGLLIETGVLAPEQGRRVLAVIRSTQLVLSSSALTPRTRARRRDAGLNPRSSF